MAWMRVVDGRFQARPRNHLQAATKAFYASRWVLTDRRVSASARFNYFHAVITPIALFASAHRVVLAAERKQLDVACRKLLRQVAGPPGGIDWASPWHDILHIWHERMYAMMEDSNLKLWSEVHLRQYWRFVGYVANLPAGRWVSRVLKWSPVGTKSQGRPRKSWEDDVRSFCREFEIGDWRVAAQDQHAWARMEDDFLRHVSAC